MATATPPSPTTATATTAVCLRSGAPLNQSPATITLDPAQPWREALAAIGTEEAVSINFGSITDGRGYSLAARIREAGLPLTLHAIGKLHEDHVYFLKRSGFDIAHLPQRPCSLAQGIDTAQRQALLHPFTAHYQSGYDGSRGLIGGPASPATAISGGGH